MRVIDGRTIEVDCTSCAVTFLTCRGEDGEPDEEFCPDCWETLEDHRRTLAQERDRVWFETFLSFPFKQLPAPSSQFTDAELTAIDLDVKDSNDAELHRCPQCGRWTDSVESFCSRCSAAARVLADLDWADEQIWEHEAWKEHQDLLDTADEAAFYSPSFEDPEVER